MQRFVIKRNDTSPQLRAQLVRQGASLVGASVVFNMATTAGVSVIARAVAQIVDGPGMVVGFTFSGAQTADAGEYFAEFEVTYADGAIETFPGEKYILVTIPQDLG